MDGVLGSNRAMVGCEALRQGPLLVLDGAGWCWMCVYASGYRVGVRLDRTWGGACGKKWLMDVNEEGVK